MTMASIVLRPGGDARRERTQIRTTVIDGAPLESGPLAVEFDLLEREGELARVSELIAATRHGGRLLAIEGPPRIGKTALLAQARAHAQEAGLRAPSGRG